VTKFKQLCRTGFLEVGTTTPAAGSIFKFGKKIPTFAFLRMPARLWLSAAVFENDGNCLDLKALAEQRQARP